VAERQDVLTGHISAALRRLLGMRTLVDAAVGSGMMAQVVGAVSSPSRFLFCVTGPQAVDLATLWYSPDGAVLCSFWGHTENVALLSMAGKDSTCWYAEAFKAAVKTLSSNGDEIAQQLRVAKDTPPYAVDISTFRGPAAAAFDGAIYSPVVATRRRDIKCVAVGCRSSQRRCHHTVLVLQLDRLALGHAGDGYPSDATSEDEDGPVEQDADEDGGLDDDELVAIAKQRQKRNLVSCVDEDRQGLMWARSSEWAAVELPSSAIFSPSTSADDGHMEPPAKPPTVVHRMAELGLAYDPSVVLHEKSCSVCGAKRPDSTKLDECSGLLYCYGNGVEPLPVRVGLSSVLPSVVRCLVSYGYSLLLSGHELTQAGPTDLTPSNPCSARWTPLPFCAQVTIGSWVCPKQHVVEYDGDEDGLFSLRKPDDMGRVLVFTRSFCDALLSFIYNSRSSYSAATNFLASLRSGFGLRRQLVILLGRCFVATLQPIPELFVCPICGSNPDYIVIDGQALGFRLRDGIRVTRPALHLPSMNLNIDDYAVIREPSVRAAIRKVVRTGDRLNKTDAEALGKLHAVLTSVRPRAQRAATIENWRLKRHAGALFFRFFFWTNEDDLVGPHPRAPGGRRRGQQDGSSGAAAAVHGSDTATAADDATVGVLGDAPAATTVAVPWYERAGTCHPRFDTFQAEGTEWATLRPFILAMLGDPVVNLFAGQPREPLRDLAQELCKQNGGDWRMKSTAANAVGIVANFFARIGPLLCNEPALCNTIGALLLFAVEVDKSVDDDFQTAAKKASDAGQSETLDFCKRWLGVTTPEEYDKFAAEHPAFKNKALDSSYATFEFFGFLKRVRPAIFTPRAKTRKRAASHAGGGGRRKGSQAVQEDAGDRCAKSFPKHSQLTAGVFNIVCPHVVTMGFRVMFQAESVADALSLVLERFPSLPRVVFYDVACKMDRNGMQRVRSILSHHGVRFCLDRAHAKGHTCSCVYNPDESLSVTNCVSTQAAEVQHSVSVKFRGHLTYMSPTSFMAHRIAQLSFMNLTASFKASDEAKKAENDGVRLNAYYYEVRGAKCLRSECTCPASVPRATGRDRLEVGGSVESAASPEGVDGGGRGSFMATDGSTLADGEASEA